jgi:plasmid maintenance system antidote protein VapI
MVHRIKGLDNLNDCYLAALQLIHQIHAEHPGCRVIVDYTGGTKSMTAGLAAAALDDGRCEIQLVTGSRPDLHKVADRTEFVRPVHVWDTQATRRMNVAKELMARFDYAGAAKVLEEAAARFASDATLNTLQRWLSLCRAFDAWDRFDHATARRLIQPYRGQFVAYARFLDAVLQGKTAHGFEWVEDLLLNAERRGVQGRFDDAVGRLYRALELMAQRWLELRHDIQTGNVEMARVPVQMKDKLEKARDEKGEIKIGLLSAWDLIASFEDDPLAAHFNPERSVLRNFLNLRNMSLFAHGTAPISERDYREHSTRVQGFLRSAMDSAIADLGRKRVATLRQFPTQWE